MQNAVYLEGLFDLGMYQIFKIHIECARTVNRALAITVVVTDTMERIQIQTSTTASCATR